MYILKDFSIYPDQCLDKTRLRTVFFFPRPNPPSSLFSTMHTSGRYSGESIDDGRMRCLDLKHASGHVSAHVEMELYSDNRIETSGLRLRLENKPPSPYYEHNTYCISLVCIMCCADSTVHGPARSSCGTLPMLHCPQSII
jgi:hypothetical protein